MKLKFEQYSRKNRSVFIQQIHKYFGLILCGDNSIDESGSLPGNENLHSYKEEDLLGFMFWFFTFKIDVQSYSYYTDFWAISREGNNIRSVF